MFEKDSKNPNRIIKISGKDRFLEVVQAFSIGKIMFSFRIYDESKQKGSKVTKQVDCYLDIDEAYRFAKIAQSGRLLHLAQQNEAARAQGGYNIARPAYENYGGSRKRDSGVITSKKLSVTMKAPTDALYKRLPFTIKGESRPGTLSDTGAIVPDMKKDAIYVEIGLTYDNVIELGIAIERACAIYDAWTVNEDTNAQIKQLRYQIEDLKKLIQGHGGSGNSGGNGQNAQDTHPGNANEKNDAEIYAQGNTYAQQENRHYIQNSNEKISSAQTTRKANIPDSRMKLEQATPGSGNAGQIKGRVCNVREQVRAVQNEAGSNCQGYINPVKYDKIPNRNENGSELGYVLTPRFSTGTVIVN